MLSHAYGANRNEKKINLVPTIMFLIQKSRVKQVKSNFELKVADTEKRARIM